MLYRIALCLCLIAIGLGLCAFGVIGLAIANRGGLTGPEFILCLCAIVGGFNIAIAAPGIAASV